MPVVELMPVGTRQPEGLRLAVDIGQRRAGLRPRRACVAGSTRTDFIGDRSIIRPPSHTALPAMLWPPPRTATRSLCSRAKFDRAA